jgi:aminopeptidase N
VYDFATFRAYVNAVYLNGANFLDDLRSRIGDQAFFAFLEDYAATYAHGRATSQDFFAMMRRHTNRDFSDIIRTYFQNQY